MKKFTLSILLFFACMACTEQANLNINGDTTIEDTSEFKTSDELNKSVSDLKIYLRLKSKSAFEIDGKEYSF